MTGMILPVSDIRKTGEFNKDKISLLKSMLYLLEKKRNYINATRQFK